MASSARAARARADALARAKRSLSDAAAMEMRATLDAWWPPGTELTDEVVEEICDLVEAYASDAASYAADYFMQTTGRQSELTPADVYDREWTRKAVRTADAESGGSMSFVRDRLVDHVSRMVGRAAGDYVIRSARRPARGGSGGPVRFARVPGGGETCAFCLMLASRGFVYWSRETAGEFDHYHANCKCTVVASDEDHPALEGYDPDGLYDRYRSCREAVSSELGHGWESNRRAVLREMERRDPEWIRTGRPTPIIDTQLAPKRRRELVKTGEWDSIVRLSEQGLEVEPQDEDPSAVANIDLKIRGSLWELKSLFETGRGLDKHFERAVSKWRRLHEAGKVPTSVPRIVIDISQSSMTDQEAEAAILKNIRYFAGGDEPIAEVLLITHDGSLRRYR